MYGKFNLNLWTFVFCVVRKVPKPFKRENLQKAKLTSLSDSSSLLDEMDGGLMLSNDMTAELVIPTDSTMP